MFEPSAIERFWGHVDRGEPDACWEWKSGCAGGATPDGKRYGQFRYFDKRMIAHRVAWAIDHGVSYPPSDTIIMHRCDNPPCCNPRHLQAGTHAENMRDCHAKGRNYAARITHCAKGHPFDEQNTTWRSPTVRRCRICSGHTGLSRGRAQISPEVRDGLIADARNGMGGRRLAAKYHVSTHTAHTYQQIAKTPLSHAEAKQPALSTGPTPGNCPIIADGSPTPTGVGPTSIEGARK